MLEETTGQISKASREVCFSQSITTLCDCGHAPITIGTAHPHAVPSSAGNCRRDLSQQTRGQPILVVQERGFESAQILEQTSDMLVPLVVEEKCCGAGAVAAAQKWSTSRARWRSRSAQQIGTADS